jgi:hypothetical protein
VRPRSYNPQELPARSGAGGWKRAIRGPDRRGALCRWSKGGLEVLQQIKSAKGHKISHGDVAGVPRAART